MGANERIRGISARANMREGSSRMRGDKKIGEACRSCWSGRKVFFFFSKSTFSGAFSILLELLLGCSHYNLKSLSMQRVDEQCHNYSNLRPCIRVRVITHAATFSRLSWQHVPTIPYRRQVNVNINNNTNHHVRTTGS